MPKSAKACPRPRMTARELEKMNRSRSVGGNHANNRPASPYGGTFSAAAGMYNSDENDDEDEDNEGTGNGGKNSLSKSMNDLPPNLLSNRKGNSKNVASARAVTSVGETRKHHLSDATATGAPTTASSKKRVTSATSSRRLEAESGKPVMLLPLQTLTRDKLMTLLQVSKVGNSNICLSHFININLVFCLLACGSG